MHIRLFGTFDETRHPRVRVLREGLATHGTVRVDNAPVPIDTAMRVDAVRNPLRLLGFVPTVLAAWARLVIMALRGPRPEAVVVGHLGHLDILLARVLFARATLVLDHLISLADTAADRRLGDRGAMARLLRSIDRLSTRAADVVVIDTHENIATIAPSDRHKVVVVPVGADVSWFSSRPPHARTTEEPPSIVFFGLYTPLQGAPVIGEALRLLHERGVAHRATMVGSGQDLDATRRASGNAQVEWLDWVPADQLPGLVASHDICLGIFGTGDKATRVVPTKVHQGLAAGCAVVTSDTAPQRSAVPVATFVPPGDATALADQLEQLLTSDELDDLGAAARDFAETHLRPAVVTQALVDRLDEERGGVAKQRRTSTTQTVDPPLTPRAWLRHDLIMAKLDELGADDRLLEVGAGQGAMAVKLARQFDYTGIEADPTAAAIARARLEAAGVEYTLHEARFEEADLAPPFDAVCAFEVLEHIEDDEAALVGWLELLAPGGLLTLSVPAWQERFGPWDTAVGHFRRYAPDELEALLHRVGFVEARAEVYGFPLANVLETIRNWLAPASAPAAEDGMDDRTAASGRVLQPSSRVAALTTDVATRPFRWLQRHTPNERLATGIVAAARRPA